MCQVLFPEGTLHCLIILVNYIAENLMHDFYTPEIFKLSLLDGHSFNVIHSNKYFHALQYIFFKIG